MTNQTTTQTYGAPNSSMEHLRALTPLLEAAELIRQALLTREGDVITAQVAAERANNISQAIAHLIRGSGY